MLVRFGALFFTTTVLATACVGNDADSTRNQLLDAGSNWERAGITDYRVDVTQNDHMYVGCTWTAEVRGTEVSSSAAHPDDDECVEWVVTVPELHRAIELRIIELLEGDGTLAIDWDGNGVPLAIDYELTGQPEESLAITTQLTILAP